MGFGTLSVTDLLATTYGATTVADFSEERALDIFTQSMEAHNRLTDSMMTDFVERTTDRLRAFGGRTTLVMQNLDEFGTPDAQKIAAGENLGFPLRLSGLAVQWTRTWFLNHSVRELAIQFVAAQEADLRQLQRDIKRAIFVPTNSTFVDRRVDNISLPIKALMNADSSSMGVGPNGETFDGTTHDHYPGEATYTAVFLSALIDNVAEHYQNNQIRVYINRAQEAATRLFTGFQAYVDSRVVIPSTTEYARGQLSFDDRNNRAIGLFDGAEVWVKPWVVANYVVAHNTAAPKLLAFRERTSGSGNLTVSFEDEVHPLRAKGIEREYGISVQERLGAAVLYIANATYASPTIN